MGFLDRLLGRDEPEQYRTPGRAQQPRSARSEDEVAIERYRYLLRTAPPETIEQVHAEAFAQLTPEQRRQVYEELTRGPEAPTGDDPDALARSATRTEMRRPGTLERSFGGGMGGGGMGRMGPSFGSMVGSSLLGTVAGYVIGSALVSAFLPDVGGGAFADGGDAAGDGGATEADVAGGDAAGWGGDSGGGWGDSGGFGGDFGGGDFGGGDFGGF